ncbi:MAG TPA: SpoIID/LytB domain-containing protein, partial [Anaeromyxobacteraceae bacterium]|nr:SpoIID/LytB domain-containing protein [Anaeromyxobacteraceae bacterium]
AVCLGGPWKVRYPGLDGSRDYAGVFTWEPAPPWEPPPGEAPTARERRARRGSDLVFRTARLAYAAGVLAAEAADLRGEPRIALARVADRNAGGSRHPGRPVCDTTHCQAFLGTHPPAREDRTALADPLPGGGWLPFSRGGREPWSAERPRAAVEAVLGAGAGALAFGGGRVGFVIGAGTGDERWEERRDLPCEALRGPLKLPACPDHASLSAERVVFRGFGEGHGEGLDVEWSKRSGLSADEILRRSYGEPR